jgi:hypothetical protein
MNYEGIKLKNFFENKVKETVCLLNWSRERERERERERKREEQISAFSFLSNTQHMKALELRERKNSTLNTAICRRVQFISFFFLTRSLILF